MLAFVDIETTGTDWFRSDILTWSTIVTDSELNIIDKKTFKGRCESDSVWEYEAEQVHGISRQECMLWQPQIEMLREVYSYYTGFLKDKTDRLKWVHHARKMFGTHGFDYDHALGSFDRYANIFAFYKLFKTEKESTVHIAMEMGIKERKLNQLCDRFGIELNHHDSESDVNACYELYKKLKNNNGVFRV